MSQGNFDSCFTFTIGVEGRYSDNKNDPGNWSSGEAGVGRFIGSCWGISAPVLIDWVGQTNAGQVTPEYMKALPIETAKAIYLVRFWNAMQADKLPTGVDLAVWDFGVNAGPKESAEILQRMVGVKVDGFIGPETLAATAKQDPEQLIPKLCEAHVTFYKSLAAFAEDGHGWMNRQERVRISAIAMARSVLQLPKSAEVPTPAPAVPAPAPVQVVVQKPPKRKSATAYSFVDRAKEWTTYIGLAVGGMGGVLPQFLPADNHWVQLWQAAQMVVGAALVFIPQTAGSEAVENDAWSLLRAFSSQLPPQYAQAMQPLVATLAGHLAKAETDNIIGTVPAQRVVAVPVQPDAGPSA